VYRTGRLKKIGYHLKTVLGEGKAVLEWTKTGNNSKTVEAVDNCLEQKRKGTKWLISDKLMGVGPPLWRKKRDGPKFNHIGY